MKCVYYWKGMRKHILVHCKKCPTCAKQRVQKTQFEKQIFEPGVQPMEFLCINLIGEFYPPSSKGNRYALTAVCMLTGFTFCIAIKSKTAQEVVTSWRNHISFPFGVCRKLLMDNGTEFKNELFSQVAEQLGVERKIYTPPYRPQSNGRIEGFHNFLKSCLAKHISRNREWDDVAPWLLHHTIGCLISIQRNHLSLLCLAETHLLTLNISLVLNLGTWGQRN